MTGLVVDLFAGGGGGGVNVLDLFSGIGGISGAIPSSRPLGRLADPVHHRPRDPQDLRTER